MGEDAKRIKSLKIDRAVLAMDVLQVPPAFSIWDENLSILQSFFACGILTIVLAEAWPKLARPGGGGSVGSEEGGFSRGPVRTVHQFFLD